MRVKKIGGAGVWSLAWVEIRGQAVEEGHPSIHPSSQLRSSHSKSLLQLGVFTMNDDFFWSQHLFSCHLGGFSMSLFVLLGRPSMKR